MKSLPIVAALLLAAACNNQDLEIIDEPQSDQVRIIPYTATVGSGIPTRATLYGVGNYVFQTGDRLYVWGEDNGGAIDGELTLASGADSYEATFTGTLSWSGSSDPSNDPTLNAVIVSSDEDDQIFGSLEQFKGRNHTPAYPATIYDVANGDAQAKAVQYFGYFQAQSKYSEGAFNFKDSQYSAFILFDITLEDGTAADANVSVSISNGGNEILSGPVTTFKDSYDNDAIKVRFIAGFEGDKTKLNSSTIKLDDRDDISFGSSQTLEANKFYNVTRTYTRYKITASATIPASYGGGEKSMSTSNKQMGYQTTLQGILNEMGTAAQAMGVFVQGCTKSSGTSVDMTDLGGTPHDFQFTVAGEGDSVFTMTVTNPLYPNFSSDETITVSVTINVSKMTPPAE